VNGLRKLPLLSKVGFGIGQGAEGLHTIGVNAFLVLYYQQVLGLPGSRAGLALLIAMIADAVSDPLAGAISDRLHSRWGRRHPMMALSAIPLALTFVGLFCPPDGLSQNGLFAWLATFAVLERLALTVYNIPHLALGAEMATDYNERSTLFAFSSFFAWILAIGGYFLVLRLFFPETPEFRPGTLNPAGYAKFAAVFGAAMGAVVLLCVAGTAREIPYLRRPLERTPLRLGAVLAEIGVVLRNRSFRVVFLAILPGALIVNVNEILVPYMSLHFWGLRTDQLASLTLAAGCGLPVAIALNWLLPRWIDKRNTVLVCWGAYAIVFSLPICLRLLEVGFFPENGEPALLPLLLLTQVGVGSFAPVILILLNSILADVCDEIELESGLRLEGLVYSARLFMVKLTSGLGNFLGGVILEWIAFPSGAVAGSVPAEVLFELGVVAGPVGSAVALSGALLYLAYGIDKRRHAEIVAALRAGQAP
jgi:Na+/melibiose symporter-like transporter